MKFILSTNYKLAFRLLNQGATLAAWFDRFDLGIHRDIAKVSKYKLTGAIAVFNGSHFYRYLPTIYDAFKADCERFNVNFLILESDVKQDAIDRARNSPRKSIDDLRRLMGTEIQVKSQMSKLFTSLYSGGGGADLGAIAAGFDPCESVEYDPQIAEVT
jgi:Site-specific DNA methylase